ncbi:MAG: hypothetical protein IT208_00215 [Chthonomonadales bacterium]|nr:hypothetical protein [Chthonomonadales bacterium]
MSSAVIPRRLMVLLATLTLLGATAPARATPALERFGFRWDAAWTWEQLEARAAREGDGPAAGVRELRGQVPLAMARVLFRHLARLPNMLDARRVGQRAAIDRGSQRTRGAEQALSEATRTLAPRNDLAGMLECARALAAARARLADPFLPELRGRPYRPEPAAPGPVARLRIRFDYRVAETLLDALESGATTDAEWKRLAHDPVFRPILRNRALIGVRSEELVGYWQRAQDPDPVNRLYEWAYPGSYFDFGGVAVRAGAYRSLLSEMRAAAPNIAARAAERLAPYLPSDLRMEASVNVLFAGAVDGWASLDELGIDLEHFGDDWDYLVRVVAHECYHRGQTLSLLPLTAQSVPPEWRILHDGPMATVWREGCAAYVGYARPQPPTPAEIAAGFALFDRAFRQRGDREGLRRLLAEGIAMSGPYYRMGWHMARLIEKHDGARALGECAVLGPAHFFARYLEAAEAAGVPPAQRFRPEVETALRALADPLDAPTLLEAGRILRAVDPGARRRRAAAFLAAAKGNPRAGLGLVQAGEALARAGGGAASALPLLETGLRHLGPRAGNLVRREGYLLLENGAIKPALALFRLGARLGPGDPDRQFLLGEGYRLAGSGERARAAYRRALELSPGFAPAARALALLDARAAPP